MLSLVLNIRSTRFNQSSPFQPISDFMGGSRSVAEDGGWSRTDGRTEEILVSNIGYLSHGSS